VVPSFKKKKGKIAAEIETLQNTIWNPIKQVVQKLAAFY